MPVPDITVVTPLFILVSEPSAIVLVELIVKLGYVPVIVVAPPWVNTTVWSGAVLLKVVPTKESAVPAEYVVSMSVELIVKLG